MAAETVSSGRVTQRLPPIRYFSETKGGLVTSTFFLNVAATEYFAGLEDGTVPLNLMFSGTFSLTSTLWRELTAEIEVWPTSYNQPQKFSIAICNLSVLATGRRKRSQSPGKEKT